MGDEKNERISKDFRTGNIIQFKDITETIWLSSKMGDTCHICGENFSSDLSFTEHILNAHGNLDVVECRQCKKHFESREKLEVHMMVTHPEDGDPSENEDDDAEEV